MKWNKIKNKLLMKEKYSIFHIEGGLGKHIAAIAIAKCIKNNYPDRKLIIVCAYPEIFLTLSFIYRVYRIGSAPYFYDDFIKNKDSLIFKNEPYFTKKHIMGESNLIENWSNLYDLNYNGEMPELRFNLRQQQVGFNKWKRERPILVLQTNGGPLKNQAYPYSWTRDIPLFWGQAIVNKYKDDYHIIQIGRNNLNKLEGVEFFSEEISNMELFYLLSMSSKRILIDSCLQHASAALNLPSTVLWIGTNPDIFGYKIHDNVSAFIDGEIKLHDSYLFDYSFNGVIHECPIYDVSTMFNLDLI
jgi:hypothetical protein